MELGLKSIKIAAHLSQETTAFTATLFADGQRVADVRNTGTGGSHSYYWHVGRETREAVEAFASSQTLRFNFEKLDQLVDALLTRSQVEKQFRNWMRRSTVFSLVGDKAGSWRTLKSVDAGAVAYIQEKYGSEVAVIITPENLAEIIDAEIKAGEQS